MKKGEGLTGQKKVSMVEALSQISEKDLAVNLNERERAYLDKARVAGEKAKETSFLMGGPIPLRK